MLKIIQSIEVKAAAYPTSEFRKVSLIRPFGKIKSSSSWEDAGQLSTINITATIASDDAMLHEPAIVRVAWRGGFCILGSTDCPAMLSVSKDDTTVLSCKHLTFINP